MSDRRGLILDPNSMGLSNPDTPTSSGQQTSQQSVQVQLALKDQQSQKALQQDTGNVENQSGVFTDYSNQDHSRCNARTEPIATEYFHRLVDQLPEAHDMSAQMNLQLNKTFLKRLDEIDGLNFPSGDSKLRLITFQEWVDVLLNVNSVMFTNLSAIKGEAYGKIMDRVQSVSGEQQQTLDENRKLRKDLCAIIKLLQNAYHRNIWDTDSLSLETLTVNQILGITHMQRNPESVSEISDSECGR
ncbi:uncharacterized protein LOC6604233 [Drosophila persimilis]|uniref:uncharacterized protein LOC6604233 n=1 Tax=Drosophila persimilis TaxID=7234 RepID=UPI000F08D69F|nr:uncharacterized protein LOC6604233 [Drosophila persimilis]